MFNSRYNEVRMDLKMGPYRISPGKGMGDEFELVFTNEEGKKVESEEVAIEEDKALEDHPYRYRPTRLKPGQKYTLATTVDMGKVFGPLTEEKSFTTPKEEEDDKKKH